MREISFRGLDINGKWHYGLLAESAGFPKQPEKGLYISNQIGYPWAFQVRPETVGQYTGMRDMKGKPIYDGDICKDSDGRSIIKVYWNDHHQWGCLICKGGALSKGLTFPLWQWDNCAMNDFMMLEVIGNIYENPSLIGDTGGDGG